MADTPVHRGQDDAGVWIDGEADIALGHRQLSILDLSTAGRQLLFSPSGDYVLAFNGEVYNHLELRRELTSIKTDWNWSDPEALMLGARCPIRPLPIPPLGLIVRFLSSA